MKRRPTSHTSLAAHQRSPSTDKLLFTKYTSYKKNVTHITLHQLHTYTYNADANILFKSMKMLQVNSVNH